MGLPLGLYTHHYGKGCGKQGRGGGKKCQYHGVNQVSDLYFCTLIKDVHAFTYLIFIF